MCTTHLNKSPTIGDILARTTKTYSCRTLRGFAARREGARRQGSFRFKSTMAFYLECISRFILRWPCHCSTLSNAKLNPGLHYVNETFGTATWRARILRSGGSQCALVDIPRRLGFSYRAHLFRLSERFSVQRDSRTGTRRCALRTE